MISVMVIAWAHGVGRTAASCSHRRHDNTEIAESEALGGGGPIHYRRQKEAVFMFLKVDS